MRALILHAFIAFAFATSQLATVSRERAGWLREKGAVASCLADGEGCGVCCPACTEVYKEQIPVVNETCVGEGANQKCDWELEFVDLGEFVGAGECVCYASDDELKHVSLTLTEHADCVLVTGSWFFVDGEGGDDVIVVEDPEYDNQPDPGASRCKQLHFRESFSGVHINGGRGDAHLGVRWGLRDAVDASRSRRTTSSRRRTTPTSTGGSQSS